MTATRVYSLKGAAARVGVSVSTMRRRREQLIKAGAIIEDTGWQVPESALAQVFDATYKWQGENPNVASDTPSADTSFDTPVDAPSDGPLVEQLRSEIEFLRGLVERQARTIEEQARAQAVIEGLRVGLEVEGPSGGVEVETVERKEEEAPRRQSWWRRWFREG